MGDRFSKEYRPCPTQKALHDNPERVASLCDLSYVTTADLIDRELTIEDVEGLTQRHSRHLDGLDTYKFNLFDFVDKVGRKNYMPVITWELMKINKIDRQVNAQEFIRFVSLVYNRYQRHVQYHNDLHGVDVANHISFMINSQGVDQVAWYNSFDKMSLIVSAICHDMQHDGFTNGFHKNNRTIL